MDSPRLPGARPFHFVIGTVPVGAFCTPICKQFPVPYFSCFCKSKCWCRDHFFTSPSSAPPSPTPVAAVPAGNSLVLGGQGFPSHVRLFSQSSPDWRLSLLDGFGGRVRSREPCTAPWLAPRFSHTSVHLFSGHLLSFCCVPDTLSTSTQTGGNRAPGLKSSQ